MGDAHELELARRGLELFNTGDLETLFDRYFHPDVDYDGDPQISTLTGLPVQTNGIAAVREAWDAFFAMFDEIRLEDIEVEPAPEPGLVTGRVRMVAHGGASGVPIDAVFHAAWVMEDGRWRYLAVKLREEEVAEGLTGWLASRN